MLQGGEEKVAEVLAAERENKKAARQRRLREARTEKLRAARARKRKGEGVEGQSQQQQQQQARQQPPSDLAITDMESTPEVPNARTVVVEGQLYNFKMLCLEDSSDGDSPAELVQRMRQMRVTRMQEEGGASTGGLLASVREGTDTGDGVRQSSEVIVDEKRVWTSAEVRGWSATRELVSVQEGSNTVPISDAIWREIQRGWDESTDSDIDTDGEDGDLCLEEWDDY